MFYVMPSVLDSRVDECWRQQRCIVGAGTQRLRLYLPDLMMASTCCFMVPAGTTFLPFGLSTHSSFISFCLLSFTFFPTFIVWVNQSHFHLSHSTHTLPVFLFPHRHLPCYSTPFFHSFFHSLRLIALMHFLWSTAMSCSSEQVWPHVFQEGMTGCGGEAPQGAQTAKYQNNMSPSSLMISTVQPC